MPIPVASGLDAQLVVKDESTYGVAPSLTSGADSFEFKSETLELKKSTVQGDGLAAGRVYERTKRRVLTNYDVTGAINMDLPTRNLGWWLRYMIGDFTQTPAEIASTNVYTTTFQPRSGMLGHSFCVQKGVPTADNATVEPFTYVGCKLTGWDISVAVNQIAALTLNIDARNELAGPYPNGGASASGDPLNAATPALATWAGALNGLGMGVFHFKEATVYTGGTPTNAATSQTLASPPSVPATTIPVNSPYGQTAAVTITGGTVTTVLVNGTSVGSGDGTYFVPPGGTIAVTYSAAPTWVWYACTVSLSGSTAAGNVKDAKVGQTIGYDVQRLFIGNAGFKAEQIENAYRKISGSMTVEWLSSEAFYNAFAADTTTSLELKFVGPTVSTSNYLLDIIIPNIKFDQESPKVGGPQVVQQALAFTGLDDEATTPIQITYQSEDVSF